MDLRGLDSVATRATTEALRGSEAQAGIAPGAAEGSQGVAQTSFSDILSGVVEEASNRTQAAHAKADAFARGTLDDVHGTMIAAKEADISLKLVGSIRNKLLDAFQELWRTNV